MTTELRDTSPAPAPPPATVALRIVSLGMLVAMAISYVKG
jgi:hypothetical protein